MKIFVYISNSLLICIRSLTSSRGASFEEGRVVGAFQRFTLFWHLSREVISKLSEDFGTKKGSMKTFDVCLMVSCASLSVQVSRQVKVLKSSRKSRFEFSFSSLSVNVGQLEQNFRTFENFDGNVAGSFDDER